jgi:amidase
MPLSYAGMWIVPRPSLPVGTWYSHAAPAAREPLLEPWTLGLAAMREHVSPEELADTLAQFDRLHRQVAPHWQRFDFVLSPVADSAAPPIGLLDPTRDFSALANDHFGHVNFTHVQNMGGFPALSLPLGQSETGLPIGAMFWGPHGADDLLLDLGRSLEAAADWRDRWPPVVR